MPRCAEPEQRTEKHGIGDVLRDDRPCASARDGDGDADNCARQRRDYLARFQAAEAHVPHEQRSLCRPEAGGAETDREHGEERLHLGSP